MTERADTMTRPTVLDMDLVVVPAQADVGMLRSGTEAIDEIEELMSISPGKIYDARASHCHAAMLSASPYPTAWNDVRKYVEKLEVEAKCDEEYLDLVKDKYRSAEARIAELEADHLEERLAMSGRIQFLEEASAVPHLEHRIAELEAALDEKEVASGLTSNGNLWRFWSTKAWSLAVRNAELEGRMAESRATGRREGLSEAAQFHDNAVTRIRNDPDAYKSGNMRPTHKRASNIHEYSAAAIRAAMEKEE